MQMHAFASFAGDINVIDENSIAAVHKEKQRENNVSQPFFARDFIGDVAVNSFVDAANKFGVRNFASRALPFGIGVSLSSYVITFWALHVLVRHR